MSAPGFVEWITHCFGETGAGATSNLDSWAEAARQAKTEARLAAISAARVHWSKLPERRFRVHFQVAENSPRIPPFPCQRGATTRETLLKCAPNTCQGFSTGFTPLPRL